MKQNREGRVGHERSKGFFLLALIFEAVSPFNQLRSPAKTIYLRENLSIALFLLEVLFMKRTRRNYTSVVRLVRQPMQEIGFGLLRIYYGFWFISMKSRWPLY